MFNNSLLTRLHWILSNPINRPQKFYYKEHEVCIVQPPNISGRERLHFGTSYAFYFFIFTNMTIVLSDSTLRLEPFMKADSLDNSSLKENVNHHKIMCPIKQKLVDSSRFWILWFPFILIENILKTTHTFFNSEKALPSFFIEFW